MLETGRIVRSIAGHDRDRFYLVVATDDTRVWIADGRARKLAKPKAKNPLHVRKTNAVLQMETVTTDKKLREALRAFAAGEEGGYQVVQGRCD